VNFMKTTEGMGTGRVTNDIWK